MNNAQPTGQLLPAMLIDGLQLHAAAQGRYGLRLLGNIGLSFARALHRLQLDCEPCQRTHREATAHHVAVKADVASGRLATPHGRYMQATLRAWPGMGRMGECSCNSTLLIPDDEPEDIETVRDVRRFTISDAAAALRSGVSK